MDDREPKGRGMSLAWPDVADLFGRVNHRDALHFRWLLRARRERPYCGGA
jgi:hypothetical protein